MPDTTNSEPPSRRAFLARTGSAGLAAAGIAAGAATGLGGCGSGGGGTPSSQTGTPAGGGAVAGGGGELASTSDIPVGSGKIFPAQKVVVTQPTAGTFKGFSAVCTHQGCTVASISNGIIRCPCHGSQYSIVDGSVRRGPAPAPLAPEQLTVKNGGIFLS